MTIEKPHTWRILFSRRKLQINTMTGTQSEIIARVTGMADTGPAYDDFIVESMTDQIDFYTIRRGHRRLFMTLMFEE